MKTKLIYATDLDRTLIFSHRFLAEHPSSCSYSAVEYKGLEIISYMLDKVKESLKDLNKQQDCLIVPITTRSIEEYKRINLGFKPEYAIISNGGTILHNDKPIEEWNDYVNKEINIMETMSLNMDISELQSINYTIKFIDNKYLFYKISDIRLYDKEIETLINRYENWQFIRQRNKGYAIPKHFSKQIALRWLWTKTDKPFIVASGDSELDLPMLTLANRAIIPSHGTLIEDKFVESATTADGGIESPLYTIKIVNEELDKLRKET